jgi:RloB-like protein
MGGEDLFYKKRERKTSDFKRNSSSTNNPVRQTQARVLIVCEDSKSSVFYLKELAKDLGLNAVTVEGERCGSAPSSVLKFAQEQHANSVKDRDPYDRVFCVFDRDQHPCFEATVQAISDIKSKNTFFAITTTPCFEFWLLLHFVYDASPYQPSGNKSSCDNTNTKLKSHWADYGKSKRGIYTFTKDKTQKAVTNAKQLAIENLKTGSNNPQTNMHELIEYLQSIKR